MGDLWLERAGAALLTLAALAAVLALALTVDVISGGHVSWWHGLTGPLVASGLVGVALVHLGAEEAWRPGVVAVMTGVAVGLMFTPVVGPLATVSGGVVAALGGLAVLLVRGRWPDPLEAAAVAAALQVVVSGGDLTGATWLLAAGCFARIARVEGAPPLLDAVVSCGSVLVLAATLAPAPVAPAVALAVALVASALYGVDAARRGRVHLDLSQPLRLVAAWVWARGIAGAAFLSAFDVHLHDTFAEVAPEHLLGPILTLVMVLAWLAHRVPATPWSWAGMAASALVLSLGARSTEASLWEMGVLGLPRRYYVDYLQLSEGGWVELALGAALFAAGGAAAAVVLAVAVARSGLAPLSSPRDRPPEG